jgi:hypothetical protein
MACHRQRGFDSASWVLKYNLLTWQLRNSFVCHPLGEEVKERVVWWAHLLSEQTADRHKATEKIRVNPLNVGLNPIYHFLALLGAHHILHVSRVRVKIGCRTAI